MIRLVIRRYVCLFSHTFGCVLCRCIRPYTSGPYLDASDVYVEPVDPLVRPRGPGRPDLASDVVFDHLLCPDAPVTRGPPVVGRLWGVRRGVVESDSFGRGCW